MSTRTSAMSTAFRQRAATVSGVAFEESAEVEEVAELPTESWKKDDIIQYLIDNEVIESEDDVKGQTKAELIENFVG